MCALARIRGGSAVPLPVQLYAFICTIYFPVVAKQPMQTNRWIGATQHLFHQ